MCASFSVCVHLSVFVGVCLSTCSHACTCGGQDLPAVPRIAQVRFGRFEMDCWHMAPYPEEYRQRTLYVCEFCLAYMGTVLVHDRHRVRQP
jgi:hypothetical protein